VQSGTGPLPEKVARVSGLAWGGPARVSERSASSSTGTKPRSVAVASVIRWVTTAASGSTFGSVDTASTMGSSSAYPLQVGQAEHVVGHRKMPLRRARGDRRRSSLLTPRI
jgi:hypothetical protein